MSVRQLEKRAFRALYWHYRRKEEGDVAGAESALGRFLMASKAISELVTGPRKDLLIV